MSASAGNNAAAADAHSSDAGPPSPRRLLDRLRDEIRSRHYSIRTEDAYVDWARRYIHFHGRRHPQDMGAPEVSAFLTHLATERNVSASTQNQAKSALLFLYGQVLNVNLPWLDEVVSARVSRRLPVVLTPSEVRALLHELSGTMGLVTSLLYGTGMRLLEGLRLRVKDVEFERRELLVRNGKGGKDRVTVLPENLMLPLRDQLVQVRRLHDANSRRGEVHRHHLYEQSVQRAVSGAAPASSSPARRMCSATVLQRTCCSRATTSAPCRSCSATRT